MVVLDDLLKACLQSSETGKIGFPFIALARLTSVSPSDSCTMFIPLTLALYYISTVIIEGQHQCFVMSISLTEPDKSTSRAEERSPDYLHFKAVETAGWGLP